MDFYSDISKYYDFIFPLNEMQLRFILAKLNRYKLDAQVLDIGCGTGSLAIELYETGYQVTGIDLKGEMIKKAIEKAGSRNIKFLRANMNEIHKYNEDTIYDSALCLGNTLVHLESLGQVKRFADKIKQLLNPKGSFIFQIINYDRVLKDNVKKLDPIENEQVKFERNYILDLEDFKITFHTLLTLKEEGNKIIENKIKLLPIRKIEIDIILNHLGFSEINYFGNFKGEEWTEDSLHLIVEAIV